MSEHPSPDVVLSGRPIVVDETAMVFWDDDHARTQRHFLDHLDPGYFRYAARGHEARLAGDDAAHAGIALRIAYSHAIEALFALIGAAVQAPHCPAGWVLKYRYIDLKNLIRKISATTAERTRYDNLLGLDRGQWPDVVAALTPWDLTDDDLGELRAATVALWKPLARTLLDPEFDDEYMSLKHGFRVQSGPWSFAIGAEDIPGVPAPPEKMRTLAFSPSGSTFYQPTKLKPHSWCLREPRVNWNPGVFASITPLIADSMENVLAFLKLFHGGERERFPLRRFTRQQVSAAFHDPDLRSSSVRVTWNRLGIDSIHIPELTQDDIRDQYRTLGPFVSGDQRQPER